MEASFFGCSTRPDASSSAPRSSRIIRRNVWSSDLQEEDGWIDALLSNLTPSSSPRIILSSQNDTIPNHEEKKEYYRVANNDDCELIIDAVTNNDDDSTPTRLNDGIPNIPNTEIPKIIHFIWLGGDKNSIPSFPFLNFFDDGDELTFEDKHHGKKECHNIDVAKVENKREKVMQDSKSIRWNECMNSWAKHHLPSRGWIIQLWTEEDIALDANQPHRDDDQPMTSQFQLDAAAMHNYEGYRYAIKCGNYGMASDILRLEILNKFGGIYVDIDYWCIGSFDDLLVLNGPISSRMNAKPVQFFCGASNAGCIELNNGILACKRKGHPIVWNMMTSIHSYIKQLSESTSSSSSPPVLFFSQGKQDSMTRLITSFFETSAADKIVEYIRQQAVSNKLSSMEVIEQTGPGLLTRSVCRWIVRSGGGKTTCQTNEEGFCVSQVVIFPSKVFHPFPNNLRKQLLHSTINSDANMAMMSSSLHKLLVSYVTTETKAVHLWGCSWQESCINI